MGGGKFCQLIRPILLRILKKRYHIELGCREIGPYLRLPHPYGIIIAAKSIGENVMIGQYVTLGGNNCKERQGSNGEPIHTPVIHKINPHTVATIANSRCNVLNFI